MTAELQALGWTAVTAAALLWLRSRALRQLWQTMVLAEVLELRPEDRVLVVAPHCDDETLGSGGLLYRAVQLGCAVRVVVMTNGDGFRYGVTERYRRLRPGPEAYIRYAYQRQEETVRALARLGVGKEHVEFLGYPDRGLAHMWDRHWDPERPYTSRFTRRNRSPYHNSRTPGALYCGLSVLRDLQEILREFRPTVVVLPHSYDAHIDHWATHAFVVYAVEALAAEDPDFVRPQMYAYLIHRGRWPFPKGRHPSLRLLPPPAMADVVDRWLVLPLDPAAVQAKLEAILCYRSQIALMRQYLLSFARCNELFVRVQPVRVRALPEGGSVSARAETWLGPVLRDEAAIRNPVRDTLMRRLQGRADIRTLGAVQVGERLLLRLELRRRPSALVRYVIHLVAIDGGAGRYTLQMDPRGNRARLTGGDRGETVQMVAERTGSGWRVAVPLSALGYPRRIFVSAETRMAGLQISSVGWTLLELERAS